jgi:hypothetical protein
MVWACPLLHTGLAGQSTMSSGSGWMAILDILATAPTQPALSAAPSWARPSSTLAAGCDLQRQATTTSKEQATSGQDVRVRAPSREGCSRFSRAYVADAAEQMWQMQQSRCGRCSRADVADAARPHMLLGLACLLLCPECVLFVPPTCY